MNTGVFLVGQMRPARLTRLRNWCRWANEGNQQSTRGQCRSGGDQVADDWGFEYRQTYALMDSGVEVMLRGQELKSDLRVDRSPG